MIINAINGNGNRLIRVNKDTNKDAIKEFLVTTLSQCDTNGHFIETPYSESKLLDKYLGEVGSRLLYCIAFDFWFSVGEGIKN